MTIAATSDLWWKNAVIYCLDVETFADGNGDGIGDFVGLTQRLDHLAGLGVTCVWLMPFFPTNERDDGYDITDFYGVDPRLGDHGDVVEFVNAARDRGIRVIADLVVNHTSDQHPWFQAARADRSSPFRDFYVWRDEPPEVETLGEPVFPDKEDSIWTYDDVAGQYYLHHFYSHQPDLNIANPDVRHHVAKAIAFWLQLGLSGFRVDAVPFLIETGGIPGADKIDPHEALRDFRAFMSRRRGDAVLLGEVNLEPAELQTFFGDEDGDELHMQFNFLGMQNLYLALARGDARPLEKALLLLPPVPEDNQWGNFVRNHDELTLDKLDESQRAEVFAAFGPDPDMQLFDRGLRRRLPPMLGGDQRKLRLVYSLLFTLPGTPVLFYGEEIGMGENLAIDGRMAVRTPMQWSNADNAGFSTVEDPKLLCAPVTEGAFGPAKVNVADQRHDPDSLLSWMERIIRRRRETPEFGWGTWKLVETQPTAVFALRCDWEGSTVLAVHNLAGRKATVTFPADLGWEALTDILDGSTVPLDGEVSLELEGYGYRWLKADQGALPPSAT